jgi:hypothetical protein
LIGPSYYAICQIYPEPCVIKPSSSVITSMA